MDMYKKRKMRTEKKNNNQEEKLTKVGINWYPGHMVKAKREIKERIKLIDIIYECIDARMPSSSKLKGMDDILEAKPRILVMTKKDLCDLDETNKWVKYYEEKGYKVILVDLTNNDDYKKLIKLTLEVAKPIQEKRVEKGLKSKEIKIGVVGIPNVGKSTLINKLAGKKVSNTGNKPGVTKQVNWLKTSNGFLLLDTPGILWPKFEDQTVGLRLAFIGSIKDELSNQYELCMLLMQYLGEHYPKAIPDTYQIEPAENEVELLERVAKRRGCLKAGGEHDLDKAANYVIDDFRNGRLGCISLEQPEK